MKSYPRSEAIFESNLKVIPGGVVSINRATHPRIVFAKGEGPFIWDVEGNQYLDYHAAFAPHFLGHNDPHVSNAVRRALDLNLSLFGTGTTELEGVLAGLLVKHIDFVESVQLLNTGSEATYQAIRLARAVTGCDHIIVMQGGYNGWHNDVACNLMTPLDVLGDRVSPGEYAFAPISAGIPEAHQRLVHAVNFNDLASVEYVCGRYPIACLITEPVLQNIGVIHPRPGYLEGLRGLANRFGFVLVFDEVKTGFRHALGGYANLCGVQPDLAIYGKALANGYPIAAIGGRKRLMDWFAHPDPAKRVLLAGTYNSHPVPVCAAIATIERLVEDNGAVYRHVEILGSAMEAGIRQIIARVGVQAVVARQGSAFCIYFMDHPPLDWHDLASHHAFELDGKMRRNLIEDGIYFFPMATKQCSISAAHRMEHVEETLEKVERVLKGAIG